MSGMNRTTGAALATTTDAHLQQSITDILTTPVGSRVARRDYGSQLPDLIDQPFNPALVLKLYAATGSALKRWESRLKISKVSLTAGASPGKATLCITGTRTDRPAKNSATTFSITLSRNAS